METVNHDKQLEYHIGANLSELLKKVIHTFCEVNINFTSRLDVYGSIHVRSDDCDITSFVLNEHTYRQETHDNLLESIYERQNSYTEGSSKRDKIVRRFSGVGEQSSRFNLAKNDSTATRSQPENNKSTVAAKSQHLPIHIPASDESDADIGEHNKGHVDRTLGSRRNRTTDVLAVRNALRTEALLKNIEHLEAAGEITEGYTFSNEEVSHREKVGEIFDGVQGKRSYGLKVEPPSEPDDFEPDHSSMQCEEGDVSYDVSNDARRGSNSSAKEQYFSGDVFKSQMAQAADWIKTGEYSPGHSIVDSSRVGCAYCMQSFTSNVQLRKHIQQVHDGHLPTTSHTGRQQCQVSGSELAADGSFHEKYSCSICGLLFRSRDGLRCHVNAKHSQNKLYRCQFCGQSFLTRQASYQHRLKFHRLVVSRTQKMN